MTRGPFRVLGLLLGGCCLHGCDRAAPPHSQPQRAISRADRFYDVAAIDAEHIVVVGYDGKILRTTDGGASWTRPASGTGRALYSVDFVDGLTGWISGQDGVLLRTTDGGSSWGRLASPTTLYVFAIDFIDRQRGWAVGDRSVLLDTRDGGATWAARTVASARGEASAEDVAAAESVLYDVRFVTADVGWIVGEFGKILHTTDGGVTWAAQQGSLLGGAIVDVLDIPTFFGARFLSTQAGVVTGGDGRLARTTDGGTTWAFEATLAPATPLFQPFLSADGATWAVGAEGTVLRQSAPGARWDRVADGAAGGAWLRAMDWSDARHGWIVGGYGAILRTTDGGQSWTAAGS